MRGSKQEARLGKGQLWTHSLGDVLSQGWGTEVCQGAERSAGARGSYKLFWEVQRGRCGTTGAVGSRQRVAKAAWA